MVELFLVLGVAGAALCAASDLVLLGGARSGREYQQSQLAVMETVSPARLLVGHALGVFSLPLALGGLPYMHAMLAPAGPAHAAGSIALLAWMFAVGTAFHGLWAPMGHSAQLLHPGLSRDAVVTAQQRYWRWLFTGSSIAFFTGGLWLGGIVAAGWTSFPRWYAVLTPAPLMMTLQTVSALLPAPIGGWLAPAASNLVWVVVFGVPLVVGWRP